MTILHRVGSFKEDYAKGKSRPIIVKFARYVDSHSVFVYKKALKGKNIFIIESLTKERMSKLKEAKEQYGFKRVWTIDRKILYTEDDSPSAKPEVYYE